MKNSDQELWQQHDRGFIRLPTFSRWSSAVPAPPCPV